MISMRTLFALVIAQLCMTAIQGWWDNSHMLSGAVCEQLMDKKDVATVSHLLSTWDEFDGMNTISTAPVWADYVKCSNTKAEYCAFPGVMSMYAPFGDWHYVSIETDIANPDESTGKIVGGNAQNRLFELVNVFKSTKSQFSANFMIRFGLHIFTDIHNPLHATEGSYGKVSGDRGGNNWKFESPCAASNLHALWDSAGAKYTTNWIHTSDKNVAAELQSNATRIIQKYGENKDEMYEDLRDISDYYDFAEAATTAINATLYANNDVSKSMVYKGLNLNDDGKSECPSEEYFQMVQEKSDELIYMGGYRLSVLLTKIAHRMREVGIVKEYC